MTVQALHSRALWLYENDSADWLLGMQVAYEDFVRRIWEPNRNRGLQPKRRPLWLLTESQVFCYLISPDLNYPATSTSEFLSLDTWTIPTDILTH